MRERIYRNIKRLADPDKRTRDEIMKTISISDFVDKHKSVSNDTCRLVAHEIYGQVWQKTRMEIVSNLVIQSEGELLNMLF